MEQGDTIFVQTKVQKKRYLMCVGVGGRQMSGLISYSRAVKAYAPQGERAQEHTCTPHVQMSRHLSAFRTSSRIADLELF